MRPGDTRPAGPQKTARSDLGGAGKGVASRRGGMGGSWILDIVRSSRYVGIALLMCLENLFPPIPSELIMPLAGVLAAEGDLSLAGTITAGSAGSLAGQAGWYWLGLRLGDQRLRRLLDRHGRWWAITPSDLTRAETWLRDHGALALLGGRLVPTVRTLISLPAGLARVPPWRFLAYSAIGTTAWTAALALAGHALRSRFERVHEIVGPVSVGVLVLLVGWYVWRVATWRRSN